MKKIFALVLVIVSFSMYVFAQQSAPTLLCNAEISNDGDGILKSKEATPGVFEVLPDQANNKLSIKFNATSNVESLKLINAKSDTMFESGKARGAGGVVDIPIEDLEPGTYFVRVKTDQGISVQRIIISK
jgi:hypothetical protein